MKKGLLLICLIFLAGCSTLKTSSYIQDDHPYEKVFYATFSETLQATREVLTSEGWKIEKEIDPSVYERARTEKFDTQKVLVITKQKHLWTLTGKKEARINIYLRTGSEAITEAELRLLLLGSVTVKTFKDYKDDALANQILEAIQKKLE